MRTLLAVIPVLLATATASAQPALDPIASPFGDASRSGSRALTPFEVPAQPSPSPVADDGGKDPGVAIALSVGGTLVPVLMVASSGSSNALVAAGAVGMVFGPSLGHWYAGDYLSGGLLMRVGGVGLMAAGLGEALDCLGDDTSCHSGAAPLVIGGALFVTGTIYDIATAGRSAHAWNAEHLRVAPSVISSNGHSSMGVGLGGTF